MKYKCIIKDCPTNGYATSIDGDYYNWPLCSTHFEQWGIYLAGVESKGMIFPHTLEWDITVEKFIAFTENHTLDCTRCNLHLGNSAYCEYHGSKLCPRNL